MFLWYKDLQPVNICLFDVDESDEEPEIFANNGDEDPDFTAKLNRTKLNF